MRLAVKIEGDIGAMMKAEYKAGERAVSGVMRGVSQAVKADWRGQVVAAGLGVRLGNTIRGESYPKGATSMNAAALVWSKAPKITAAHEAGPLIRAIDGIYIAIPTEEAGRSRSGERPTPAEWHFRTGKKLRFVRRRGHNPVLVLDDARINTRGQAVRKGGRRRKDGILTGAQTVVIFILVQQVKLRKRLNLMTTAEKHGGGIPAQIVAAWKT